MDREYLDRLLKLIVDTGEINSKVYLVKCSWDIEFGVHNLKEHYITLKILESTKKDA